VQHSYHGATARHFEEVLPGASLQAERTPLGVQLNTDLAPASNLGGGGLVEIWISPPRRKEGPGPGGRQRLRARPCSRQRRGLHRRLRLATCQLPSICGLTRGSRCPHVVVFGCSPPTKVSLLPLGSC